ncbi:MAG: RNHCP domain-containing protein [Mollicutes bacterium]|jgi:Zn finger protein HypA/HybF involved in hydrogenase expression|nr:RNHCP domain-containing protein [Mollicutes bacterium]
MNRKLFKMIDESFRCENCNREVTPLLYTARDHCNYCLYSKHVDINPGDRLESCHGLLVPVDIEKNKKSEYKIIYQCNKCNKIRKNIMARDDNYEEILKITNKNN